MLDIQKILGNSFSINAVENPVQIEHKGDVARALFQKWVDEDVDQEHKQTFEYLADALDRDRLSDRKLFPVERFADAQHWCDIQML